MTNLMLSTWIRRFTNENKTANSTAEQWSEIINNSFAKGYYDHDAYIKNFEKTFNSKVHPKAVRHIDFVHFYTVSIVTNTLNKNIEPFYFDYILNHENGIYYIYDKKLSDIPKLFQSKDASKFLRAIELLSKYENPECKNQLRFALDWLEKNKSAKNTWDMGKESKDGISFPLSDSWRTEENRINDCTYSIKKLLGEIEMS